MQKKNHLYYSYDGNNNHTGCRSCVASPTWEARAVPAAAVPQAASAPSALLVLVLALGWHAWHCGCD